SLHHVSVLSKHQDAESSPHAAVSVFSGRPSGSRGRHGGSNYARDGTRIARINLAMTALHPNFPSSSALEGDYACFASLSGANDRSFEGVGFLQGLLKEPSASLLWSSAKGKGVDCKSILYQLDLLKIHRLPLVLLHMAGLASTSVVLTSMAVEDKGFVSQCQELESGERWYKEIAHIDLVREGAVT
ncbi:hypothetical protein CPC08DRAFT_704884, partial [Agrocybe pediades]